ncbi:internal scaffolding protein [Microviridae sp.]|nr:internal scaffolding protein [Microviridae sp.]
MPTIRKPYAKHERVTFTTSGQSRTQQHMAAECDINNIMRKYQKTGLIDHVNEHVGDYGNFIGFEDYQTSMQAIKAAEAAFMTIPSSVRAKFDNDPAKFLNFVQNEENLEEMVEMGLARRENTTPVPPAEPLEGSPEPSPAPPEPTPEPA